MARDASASEIAELISDRGVDKAAMELHRRLAGKIAISPKAELTEDTLELLYTPGVGAVSGKLTDDPDVARELTWRGNSLAVVSDGSAVLTINTEPRSWCSPRSSTPPG